MEVDWEKAFTVAVTGVISVFLALGILNVVVSFSGYLFQQAAKKQTEKSQAGT